MYRHATINAYDVMDEVWIHASLTTKEPDGMGSPQRTTTASVQVKSSGEYEDRRWLRDALVALAETL